MPGCRAWTACTDNGFLLFIRSVPQCTPQGGRCQKHDSQHRAVGKETGEKESEAAGKRGAATGPSAEKRRIATGSSAEKRVRKTVENPTETGSALRKTGEETAEMGNVETTVSGAVSKE